MELWSPDPVNGVSGMQAQQEVKRDWLSHVPHKCNIRYHRPMPLRGLKVVTAEKVDRSSGPQPQKLTSKISRDTVNRTMTLGQRCQQTQIRPHRTGGKGFEDLHGIRLCLRNRVMGLGTDGIESPPPIDQ